MADIRKINGNFAVGQSETDAIKLNQWFLSGITITGSSITSGSITFLVSNDGVTYYPLYGSDSAEVYISASGIARSYALKPFDFYPWNFVKAREGTSASPVLQATDAQSVEFTIRST